MEQEFDINIFSNDSQVSIGSTTFTICIRKRGIEEQDERCLATINLEIFRSPQFFKLRDYTTLSYKGIITDYHNTLVKRGGFFRVHPKLKNGGKAMFCMMLRHILTKTDLLSLEDILLLRISPDDEDEEDRIIRHYIKLGFVNLDDRIMIGKVKDIYSYCDLRYFEERIRNVILSI
jgi:hypothetical protein